MRLERTTLQSCVRLSVREPRNHHHHRHVFVWHPLKKETRLFSARVNLTTSSHSNCGNLRVENTQKYTIKRTKPLASQQLLTYPMSDRRFRICVWKPIVVLASRTSLGASFHFVTARKLKERRASSVRTRGSCSSPATEPRVSRADTCSRYSNRRLRRSGAFSLFRRRCTIIRSRTLTTRSTFGHFSSIRCGVICSWRQRRSQGGFLWYLGIPLGQIEGPLTEIVDNSWDLQGYYIQFQPPCNKVKHCTLSSMFAFHAVKNVITGG